MQMPKPVTTLGILALCALALATCAKMDDAPERAPERQTAPAAVPARAPSNAQEKAAQQAVPAPTGAAALRGRAPTVARVVEAAPPPRLYEQPVERRLHSDRIEASSFLWIDWNKFQENYHPNYIMDGDPRTAWVEGADASGKGEWVRIHVSPVEGTSRIRLRIRNGYHKSPSLHRKNARARKIEVTTLPGGHSHVAELADDMSWQEIAFDQPAARVEAIALEILEVLEGEKYTDLCISDVEVYVTGLTMENPAFEKAKLDELLAWKRGRLAAAKLFASKQAATLPILSGYRVVQGETVGPPAGDQEPNAQERALLQMLRQAAGSGLPDAIAERASAALRADFSGWVPVRVVARPPLELPDVDGLKSATGEDLVYGSPADTFVVPAFEGGLLLRSSHLSTLDRTGEDPRKRDTCKPGRSEFLRPPRASQDGPLVRELVLVSCTVEETRDGKATMSWWQLLEFDDEGNLVLMTTPSQEVVWLQWELRDEIKTLIGGLRIRWFGDPVERLIDARTAAAE
jgi:hypothetical protein